MVRFNDIADLYQASNVKRQASYQAFDIFQFNELGKGAKKMMPPHRRGFCTIIFMKDQKAGQLSINQNTHTALSNTLLFQGEEHIFSFVRDDEVKGTILLIKPSFLLPLVDNLEMRYPFFSLLNQNQFHLNPSEQHSFDQLFRLIIEEKEDPQVIKPLIMALLERSKTLYNTYTKEEKFLSKRSLLLRKYKNLISNYFLDHKEVSFYANQLNISPNYLNEIVKSETGISAKRQIIQRVLLEAQNLLLYSEMDIAEVSHLLQFSEPTHFTKFFKKETGITPKSFQQQKP